MNQHVISQIFRADIAGYRYLGTSFIKVSQRLDRRRIPGRYCNDTSHGVGKGLVGGNREGREHSAEIMQVKKLTATFLLSIFGIHPVALLMPFQMETQQLLDLLNTPSHEGLLLLRLLRTT